MSVKSGRPILTKVVSLPKVVPKRERERKLCMCVYACMCVFLSVYEFSSMRTSTVFDDVTLFDFNLLNCFSSG